MKNNVNFQQKLDQILVEMTDAGCVPNLLLHVCCAPCSSYVLEYLSNFFHITLYFYNPNIAPKEEFDKRVMELRKFVSEFPVKYPVRIEAEDYQPDDFYRLAKGLEQEPEGGSRCYRCYERRLEQTAEKCRRERYDYFTTTLSVSPYKRAEWLNEIGERLAEQYDIHYLVSDFKKRDGYRRSIELSKKYQLYRQDYCGCEFSKAERDRKYREAQERSGG